MSAGLAAEGLTLEVTESVLMEGIENAITTLNRIREMGVTLSIDDFGTGFSNLSYLRRFPVDRLKIDLSFVREITTDPGSLAISEAIITMSHSLSMQVVAEGVETEGQLEQVRELGCDAAQGYAIGRPVNRIPLLPEDMMEILNA